MNVFKYLKGVWGNMLKVQTIDTETRTDRSALGKRRLDYTYSGFISSTARPPLASPKLEENSGVKKDGKSSK